MRKFTLPLASKDAVKKVEKAVGARGSTLGNIDSLVNKRLASFRNERKRSREQRPSFKPIAQNILNWRLHLGRRSGTRNTRPHNSLRPAGICWPETKASAHKPRI